MKKKIISIISIISVLVTLIIPMNAAQAAIGINHEFEVSLMAALDVLPGYPNDYKADDAVLQKDFVDYAYRAIGIRVNDSLSTAKNLGLNGEENITVQQAVKVIFETTEYKILPEAQGSDIKGFAQRIGLLYGVKNDFNSPISKEDAAMILYNSLQLKQLEQNGLGYGYSEDTVMEAVLDVYEVKGIVTANENTSLSGYSKASANEVRIEDVTYNVGNTTAPALIGQYVRMFYKEDKASGNDIIKWIEPVTSKNTMVKVYGCDVESVSTNYVRYTSNTGGTKSLSIASNADIIYNGVREDSMSAETVKSLTCEALFIDNGSSKGYNVIVINDYSYYMVESFSKSDYNVNDFTAKTTLSLDEDKYSSMKLYKDGAAATIDDIEKGQILAASLSKDGNYLTVEILSGSVTGEITYTSNDSIGIGGTTYDISPSYEGDNLKSGKSGTFYFDRLGKVVRCTVDKAQNSKYAYLISYYVADNGTDCSVKLFTANGEMKTFKVSENISLNSVKRSAKEVYNILGASQTKSQLITYTLKNDGSISSIDTANENYIGIDESDNNEFTMNYKGAGRYRKNNMTFNSKYLVDSSTQIFLVPYSGENDDYSIQTTSYLTNNYTYDISVYDIDEYMYAGAVVIKEGLIEPENLRNKQPMVITKVLRSVNEDNEDCIRLEGYRQGSKVSFNLANNNLYDNRGNVMLSSLTAGDVIQFGVNTKDEINAAQILYRAGNKSLVIAGGTNNLNQYWEGGTAVFPDLWATCGTVADRNTSVILVDDDGDDAKVSKTPHLIGSANVYLYENGTVTVSNKNEISIGDDVYVHEYQGKVNAILIVRND